MKRKILTVCEWGNSRSVALAWMLKQNGHDVIACGAWAASLETFAMLCAWADEIIVTDARIQHIQLHAFKSKVKVWDVGPDRYFLGYAPELVQQYQDYMDAEAAAEQAALDPAAIVP